LTIRSVWGSLHTPQKKAGELKMPEVIVRKGEPIDRALKRLKTKLDTEGILEEVRRLRAFETPTQRTKRKAKANAKRAKAKVRFVLS
jgi:small subunit ribosomal protein S21